MLSTVLNGAKEEMWHLILTGEMDHNITSESVRLRDHTGLPELLCKK